MEEKEFVEKIRQAGGRIFIVGGWVRDTLRGAVPKDKDYVVVGLSAETFLRLFPVARQVGRGFPVYLLRIDGKSSEIAFARRERKTGPGYRGFAIEAAPAITIEEDLYRRDTTMNSIAMELPERQLLVPQSTASARGPQPAPSVDTTRDAMTGAVASRRRERSALWQDSGFFQDSFFGAESRSDAGPASEFGAIGSILRGGVSQRDLHAPSTDDKPDGDTPRPPSARH